ncbi:MAG: hypothetical protein JJU00_19800 [Opitutales bacterium]|nr:hypothetical protein [Opitutales bacterium]
MSSEELLRKIRNLDEEESSSFQGWFLLAASLLLFAGTGFVAWGLHFIILATVAIFIHELGHLVAMRIFRYKNLKMMFIPLLGGLASGRPRRHDGYRSSMRVRAARARS